MHLKSIGRDALKMFENGKIIVASFSDKDNVDMLEHIIKILTASFIKTQMFKKEFCNCGHKDSEEDNRQ